MAQIGVLTTVGSIGSGQTPTVAYSNGYMVGQTPWGVANVWKICTSFSHWQAQFGGLNKLSTLAADGSADTWSYETADNVRASYYAVKQWFENRGNNNNGVLFFCRVIQTSSPPTAAVKTINDGAAHDTTLTAKWVGSPGGTVSVLVSASQLGSSYKLFTVSFSQLSDVEYFDISNAADAAAASIKSKYLTITLPAGGQLPSTITTAVKLGNGTPGTADAYAATAANFVGTTSAAGVKTGLQVFNDTRLGTGYILVPGQYSATVRAGLKTAAETYYRFALYGTPSGLDLSTVVDGATTGQLASLTGTYSAGFWPQLRVPDDASSTGGTLLVDPTPAIAGLGCRMDAEYRGPHKSPAGTTHELRGVLDVERASSGMELCDDSGTNTLAGYFVNTVRFKGNPAGVIVWGNRTFATDGRFRSINTGRVIQVVVLTGQLICEPATFEPIDERLMATVTAQMVALCKDLWKAGALYGDEPGAEPKSSDAYAVVCNRGNNTDATIAQKRLVVEVMVVPTENAEAVYLTISNVSAGSIPTSTPR